ncbi:YceD family protein [Ensifer soli]|uniref:YceD family protein n=1 Tax=Ciceribacter sp. sgz301302 TaxID=3342379 RepID=UPI0035BB5729
MTQDETPPFSYLVKVGHISANPVEVRLAANEAERRGLAALWGVLDVAELSATLQIARWKKDGVKIKGTVSATVTQACVVTLEPVVQGIREEIEQVFVPEGSRLARHLSEGETAALMLDPDGPDLPETFSGDAIDAGMAVAEHVALAIDPYPRKPGATFDRPLESSAETDVKPNPFAVLKSLKTDG